MKVALTNEFFSEPFLQQCRSMGLYTIKDIIALEPEALIERPGFDYHWLSELSRVLNEHGEGKNMQSIRGNSGG